ncbi:MAG: hypothetical protein R3B96_10620 [Pirellulaceae bacterium]
MAIRFQCPHCQGKLKVGSHKAGAKKKGPLCGGELVVPQPTAEESAVDAATEGSSEDAFLDAIVVDASQIRVDRASPVRGPHRTDAPLELPRRVVYAVGGLLVVVAMFFFMFGVLVGRVTVQRGQTRQVLPPARTKTILTGTVHRRENNQREPDAGSVVIIMPLDMSPETTVEGSKLNPSNFTGTNMPEAQLLRTFGGDVVGVDSQGRFRTTLAAGRSYQILVVSKNVTSDAPADRRLRALWGDLFVPVEPLVGSQATYLGEFEAAGATLSLDPILFN